MINTKKLVNTWDKEAIGYRFESDAQADYLANYYHLLRCLGDPNHKKILEVGSGSGQMSAYLASMGGIVHLLDISEKSLQFSKKYFELKKLPVRLYRQDAFHMKFPPESFDFVWNGGVIEHFDDADKVLMIEKMWKLVKPGGKILITVPNAHDFPFMVAKKILELRKKWSFGNEDDLTLKRMEQFAKLAGIDKYTVYAYNPVVGYWFFPYGREVANILGLNKLNIHKIRTPFGHVIIFYAKKSSKSKI